MIIDAKIEDAGSQGYHRMMVLLNGHAEWQCAFHWFDDELSFCSQELIGLSMDQARELHRRRDVAWLQS